ncbi:TrkH family potassium uptake protein [Paenibacillus thermoaerophilus]|uniref:TrkH family potassium uptake protein n=1 Tax=Paenibacillus thermoaerophilus TaxID=1215385 RepID=A0ABW2V675_9BACL|nr:TrkH family potassium uptake protein [Paenibacillus thermoaerophilus]TMV05751.1 Trk family potassium uptake protein [Paenibacillus thermoaerophilus]TMV18370.1 Trk family potassium uptake protein [Paenibacillus thermoaerophilus]
MRPAKKSIRLSPSQVLVLGMLAVIWTGAFLLSLPISSQEGTRLPLIDALFMATSAACVTGLVTVDTGTYFSIFGQIVLMILMQIGGLGFMTMSTLFALMLRKRISLRDRLVLQQALNQNDMSGLVRLVRKIILYSFVIETVGALLLAIRWSFDMSVGRAVYFGIFHSVSIFNNAGFDLFGEFRSFTLHVNDPIVNLVGITLTILGGIGFIVMADLIEWPERKQLSLHSKVVLTTSAFLIAAGTVVVFVFEFTNSSTLQPLSWSGKILASLYQGVTPRSGGTATLDIASMRQATQFFIVILMFIGAAPGSTGGGIKVTTFAVLIGAMVAMLRGKEDIVMFRNRLAKDRIHKAITLTLFGIGTVAIITMLLSALEDRHFLMILFEVTSAFATCGLSMGLTPGLSELGKVIITVTMFVGRLGPVTLAFALQPKPEKELYRYPEGQITIG